MKRRREVYHWDDIKAAVNYGDTLTDVLRDHLHFWLGAVPALERRRSRWVMNSDWLMECRRLDGAGHGLWTHLGQNWTEPETLLGIPIEIRDDGGVPHLEPVAP